MTSIYYEYEKCTGTVVGSDHCRGSFHSVLVLLTIFVTAVFASVQETSQQVVAMCNNYRTICTGLGYENENCKPDNKGSIAFQSSLSSNLENLGNQQTVIFDKVTLNEGNGYDKKTGVFTAPEEGIYKFSWTILTWERKYFISEIVHNGKPVLFSYSDGRGRTGNVTSSNSANIKMNKGDKVWIRTWGSYGKFARGGNWSNFSGNKV
ncbi:complement C1q tumor necrosis factor-related protein 3-like [Saccostrea echinata]|uniref:complement C1q tumor necrosis factor-related protein 3-like n=1 Tax=Saccostrea echinata TaxID=191078 RepID=UPI002A837576|nr:complement C1q tumor necrosis factor-related protein 3-like [Saccostrea echinata]